MNTTKHDRSWRLADGNALAARYPYTFHTPSTEAIAALRPGDEVKLIFEVEADDVRAPNAERMWVEIRSRSRDSFEGRLGNTPAYIRNLAAGDPVSFEARHIIQVSIDDPVPSRTAKYEARCFVTRAVLYDRAPVGYLYREEPEYDDDSGWRIAAGTESDDYMDEPANIFWVSLGAVLREDDSIVELLDEPPGAAFSRNEDDDGFTRLED
jgi:hypothetical protein